MSNSQPASAEDVSQSSDSLDNIAHLEMPPVNNQQLILEDIQNDDPGVAPRFALSMPVNIKPSTHGTWEKRNNGEHIWRLVVQSPGAKSLNLGFTRYKMPAHGRLTLYTPDRGTVRGPFSAADNESHGEFWSPILPGDRVVIELKLPRDEVDSLELELTSVNHGYIRFGESARKSGSCNVDVACPQGDEWRKEIRSVAVYSTSGDTFCTGFLVNNTKQDMKPYFMTAYHCEIDSSNAASLVVYWNYDYPGCREVGSPGNADPGADTLDQFQTGSFFRAAYQPSDFTLVELDDQPDKEFNVYWAGWDATINDYSGAIAIHHPNTDEKRISFEFDPTTTTSYLEDTLPGDGTHVRVEDWDVGTTEPGSSGSPLFNPDHHIVGQLHGGFAACGNDDPDWYGRLSVSWAGGGIADSRLQDWLDPTASGALIQDGRDSSDTPDAPDCDIRTDYEPGGCAGSFDVSSLADLDRYISSSFGRSSRKKYRHLNIMSSLDSSGGKLQIESPCMIKVAPSVALSGKTVSLDGRKGVFVDRGGSINAGDGTCVLSEQGSVNLKGRQAISTKDLVVQGAKLARIGWRSTVNASGSVTLESTSSNLKSRTLILGNSQLSAKTLILKSKNLASMGAHTQINIDDDLIVRSTGSAKTSRAEILKDAQIDIGKAMILTSGNRAKIGPRAAVSVGTNLEMEAKNQDKCLVASSARITFNTKSGNCAPKLP